MTDKDEEMVYAPKFPTKLIGLMKKNSIEEMEEQQFDIEIKADGRWFHEGGEIKRPGLVALFASVLSCDDEGRYWLTTPAERGQIRVEDAPFVIISADIKDEMTDCQIYLSDNLDRRYLLGKAYQLEMSPHQKTGEMRPYLLLENGLTALISRPVFYELAEVAMRQSDDGHLLTSDNMTFSLSE